MQAKVVSFQLDTNTSVPHDQTVTGVGFEGNLVFLFTGHPAAQDAWEAGMQSCIGVAADEGGSITTASVGVASDDAGTTNNSSRLQSNTKTLSRLTGSTTEATLAVTAFTPDGFTLTYTANSPATATWVHALVLAVPEVAIRDLNRPASTASGSISGLGFAPTGLVAIGTTVAPSTSNDTQVVDAILTLGAADPAGNHWSIFTGSNDGSTTMTNAGMVCADRFWGMTANLADGAAIALGLAVSSWNADGISWSFLGGSASDRGCACVFVGGCEFSAGILAKATGAAPVTDTVSGLGFDPDAVVIASIGAASHATSRPHNRLSLGATDGTTERSLVWYDTDALADANVGRRHSTGKAIQLAPNNTETVEAEADAALGSGQFSLTWTTNNGTAIQVPYWVIGEVSSETPVAGSDSGTFSSADAGTVSAAVPATDAGSLSGADAGTVAAVLAAAESGSFSATETGAVAAQPAGADTGTLSATEGAALTAALVATETGAFSAAETAALDKAMTRTDGGDLSATEGGAITAAIAATENGPLSAVSAGAVGASLAATDTGALSAVSAAAITATLAGTDAGTFGATVSADLEIIPDTPDPVEVAGEDSGAFSAAVSGVVTVAVAATDTGGLSATASGTLAAGIQGAAGGAFSAAESGVVSATIAGIDAGSLSADATGIVAADVLVLVAATITADAAGDVGAVLYPPPVLHFVARSRGTAFTPGARPTNFVARHRQTHFVAGED